MCSITAQARVQGGPKGPAPPPLEIEKKNNKYHFLSYFLDNINVPPPEKLKSKKKKRKEKKAFRFWAPPLANSWTHACCYTCNVLYTCSKYSISVERALSPVACPVIH